jgi:hypothetical protein
MLDLVCVNVSIQWHKYNKNGHMPLMDFKIIVAEQGKRWNAKDVDQAMKFSRNSIANEGKDQQQKYLKLKYGKMVSIIFPYVVIHKDGVNSPDCKEKKVNTLPE